MTRVRTIAGHIDWLLFFCTIPLLGAGLITMNSFVGQNPFFDKQLAWIAIAFIVFFTASMIDWRFMRRTGLLVTLFVATVATLALLFVLGTVTKGAIARFNLGAFFVQPADVAKLVLIFILAKYFSRRHVEIANYRHILVSGFYAFVIFALVFFQPDFGSALIIFAIWFGMVLVSGISKKHLFLVFAIGALIFGFLWVGVLRDYQKDRILTFINPLGDIHGAGYNAYQSMITVGSGQVLGKGVGFGTQSRLRFLPEYQTDFIFAAFAEEWGFIGALLAFLFFTIIIWRVVQTALRGATNFEVLFGFGLAIFFTAHFLVNVGMNIGVMPVTGITLPFMSYGGSHLVVEFLGLGMLMGMRRYALATHRDNMKNEFVGPE